LKKKSEDTLIQESVKQEILYEQKKQDSQNELREIIITILLSIATLASAWCGYQSDIWDDSEKHLLVESNHLLGESNKNILAANQLRSAHANLTLVYAEHLLKGEKEYCDFLLSHSDSIIQPALIEWQKLDPINNEDAPKTPMYLSSYKNIHEDKAYEFAEKYKEKKAEANNSNKISDKYMLLTVVFAMVLFFGGISGTLKYSKAKNLSLLVMS